MSLQCYCPKSFTKNVCTVMKKHPEHYKKIYLFENCQQLDALPNNFEHKRKRCSSSLESEDNEAKQSIVSFVKSLQINNINRAFEEILNLFLKELS